MSKVKACLAVSILSDLLILSLALTRVTPSLKTDPIEGTPINESRHLCRTHHRESRMDFVPYTETYWHNGFFRKLVKTRTTFRREQYEVWVPKEGCCAGYKPSKLDKYSVICLPICPSECEHGTCQAPNQCSCEHGYENRMNPATNHSECVPFCEGGCSQFGSCVSPYLCKCKPGYVNVWDHPKFVCKPSCPDPTTGHHNGCGANASCDDNNLCRCDEGYVPEGSLANSSLSNHFEPLQAACTPVCNPNCRSNSHCVAPNRCECDPGYEEDPQEQWHEAWPRCLPRCGRNCTNGLCTSPEVCTCSKGFQLDMEDNSTCRSMCEVECVNAECTGENVCTCREGYEKERYEGAPQNLCVPVCRGGCGPNGHCAAPGHCRCFQGYVLKQRGGKESSSERFEGVEGNSTDEEWSGNRCEPVCTPVCGDGEVCVGPNECQALEEYSEASVEDSEALPMDETTGCRFGWTGSECNGTGFCYVVFSEDSGDGDLFVPTRMIFVDNETNGSYMNESLETSEAFDWEGPRCDEQCGAWLTLTDAAKADNDSVYCHPLDDVRLINQTVGLLQARVLPPIKDGEFGRLICFVDAASVCNEKQNFINSKPPDENLSGVWIGLVTLIVLALVLTVGVWLVWRRQRESKMRQGMSETLSGLKGSEVTECVLLAEEKVYYDNSFS